MFVYLLYRLFGVCQVSLNLFFRLNAPPTEGCGGRRQPPFRGLALSFIWY
jgi:hypothetical protein